MVHLDRFDCLVVSSKPNISVDAAVSGETAAIFETILADFREFTMAVTASPVSEVKRMAIAVYESAADASLLGGNPDFYLVCQTRLLRDRYDNLTADPNSHCSNSDRRNEFISYSSLYFGVFSPDGIELARKSRHMYFTNSKSSPSIRYALSVVTALRNQDGVRFILSYQKGNIRQRTILHPELKDMQRLRSSLLSSATSNFIVLVLYYLWV